MSEHKHELRDCGTGSGDSGWTIRKVTEPSRGRVTKETVRELSGDRSLRAVKKIARKYAG